MSHDRNIFFLNQQNVIAWQNIPELKLVLKYLIYNTLTTLWNDDMHGAKNALIAIHGVMLRGTNYTALTKSTIMYNFPACINSCLYNIIMLLKELSQCIFQTRESITLNEQHIL